MMIMKSFFLNLCDEQHAQAWILIACLNPSWHSKRTRKKKEIYLEFDLAKGRFHEIEFRTNYEIFTSAKRVDTVFFCSLVWHFRTKWERHEFHSLFCEHSFHFGPSWFWSLSANKFTGLVQSIWPVSISIDWFRTRTIGKERKNTTKRKTRQSRNEMMWPNGKYKNMGTKIIKYGYIFRKKLVNKRVSEWKHNGCYVIHNWRQCHLQEQQQWPIERAREWEREKKVWLFH